MENNTEKTKNILEKIFDSCVEDMRESVREKHAFGSGQMASNDATILRYAPREWVKTIPEKVDELRRQFVKRCRNSDMIFGNKKEIVDSFNEILAR